MVTHGFREISSEGSVLLVLYKQHTHKLPSKKTLNINIHTPNLRVDPSFNQLLDDVLFSGDYALGVANLPLLLLLGGVDPNFGSIPLVDAEGTSSVGKFSQMVGERWWFYPWHHPLKKLPYINKSKFHQGHDQNPSRTSLSFSASPSSETSASPFGLWDLWMDVVFPWRQQKQREPHKTRSKSPTKTCCKSKKCWTFPSQEKHVPLKVHSKIASLHFRSILKTSRTRVTFHYTEVD